MSLHSRAATSVYAAQPSVGGDVWASTAGAFAGDIVGTVRVRFVLTALPATTFAWLAGTSTSSATGWLLNTEDSIGGMSVGQLHFKLGQAASIVVAGRWTPQVYDLYKIVTVHLVGEGPGTQCRLYIDGHEASKPAPYTAFVASATGLGVGSKPDGTLTGLNATVLEVATTNSILTPTAVAADALTDLGAALSGETHHYLAEDIAGTWADRIGAATLSKTGTPLKPFVPDGRTAHLGCVECWGDSLTAGAQSGGTYGEGWRRTLQRTCSLVNNPIAIVGSTAPNGPNFTDYDYFYSGTPTEGVNQRLATFVADLTTNGSATTATILAYGINDLITLGRTAVQLQGDIATAVGDIAAARPGRPIVVVNILKAADSVTTVGQRTQISAYIAGFTDMITTLRQTYPTVSGADVASVISDPNSTLELFDGKNPTAEKYEQMGFIIRDALLSVAR